jgi:hypothetical protein
VLFGYAVGVCGLRLLTSRPRSAALGPRSPAFRFADMRRAGLSFMGLGAVLQLAVAVMTRGAAYGVDQVQYGLPAMLTPAATTSFMAGLIAVTVVASHTCAPSRLRSLLHVPEWLMLALYFAGVAVTGQRGQLIAPVVYLAWVFGTRIRPIKLSWILIGLVCTLTVTAIISNYRDGQGVLPSSPSAVVQTALSDASFSAWLTEQTARHVPASYPFAHGSTYVAAVEGQLPGPVSRVVGAPTRTASAVFRQIIDFSDPNQGFAESYPSEA